MIVGKSSSKLSVIGRLQFPERSRHPQVWMGLGKPKQKAELPEFRTRVQIGGNMNSTALSVPSGPDPFASEDRV